VIRDFIVTILGQAEGRVSLWRREGYGRDAPYDRQKWYDYPAQLDDIVADVEDNLSKDVCITTATYSQDDRRPHLTLQAGCVWLDADTCAPENFRLPPSYIVESSNGRWQAYWVLDQPVRAAEASRVSRLIAYGHREQGADLSSWPSNKIMRVPGTSNTNWGFPFRVKGEAFDHTYTLAELEAAYADVDTTASANPENKIIDVPEYQRADFYEAQAKLPADFPLELLTKEPEIGPDGNRSEMRWRLVSELVEAGLTDPEVLAVAWQAPASSKWREDPRGDKMLRWEIAKERQKFNEGGGWTLPPAEDEPKVKPFKRKGHEPIPILSNADRARAKKLWERTWIGEYEVWLKKSIKIYNAPYHRAAAWSALSALLGDVAYIRGGKRRIPLNIWAWSIGPAATGKSEARDAMQLVVHKGYVEGLHNPDIGDDASSVGLFDKLHKMDEQATLFNSDDADGLIEEMAGKGSWKTGQMEKWTYLFDGRVPPSIRAGANDGEWCDCVFNMYMSGTGEGVFGVLTRRMFAKGFLTRMVWFIGETMEIPHELRGFRPSTVDTTDVAKILAWKTLFGEIRQHWGFRGMGMGRDYIEASAEDDDFFQKMTSQIEFGPLSEEPNWDIILPSIIRLNTTLYKMSALLAVSSGRDMITRDDMLVALYQGEELLGNLVYVANNVSDSEHSKVLDMLETFVAGYPTGAGSPDIYRAMASRGITKRDVDIYIAELEAQRRVKYTRMAAGLWTAKIVD